MGSPITQLPKNLSRTEDLFPFTKILVEYHGISFKEIRYEGKDLVTQRLHGDRKQLLLTFSNCEAFKPLLGFCRFDVLKFFVAYGSYYGNHNE